MQTRVSISAIFLILLVWTSPSLADQEASNVAHVAAGTHGRCYAKSVPTHIYDPGQGPRQQGRTTVFRVGEKSDEPAHTYDWFSQVIFVRCGFGDDINLVRVGPWHRGHNPQSDHLAIAFYRGGELLKSYSTLDIAGAEKAQENGLSKYQNVSVSVSHYTVFETGPTMIRVTDSEGSSFEDDWVIRAKTVDGRQLIFDMATGDFE